MRNPPLHKALRDFALEAAAVLSRDLHGGGELAFEVEEPGPGNPVYRYRPLTDVFISERWPRLRSLPSAEPAARALGLGAEAYLRTRGLSGEDAEPALQALIERLWEDATDFAFPEERFETVYADVEGTLYREARRTEVIAPLYGARIEDGRVELGDGLALTSEDLGAPRKAVWGLDPARGAGGEPIVMCLLERSVGADDPLPLVEARTRFARLLAGLRLWSAGGVALGPAVWARADGGSWRPSPLTPSGAARGESLVIGSADAEELRLFLDEVAHSARAGQVAWALGRFQLGCARAHDVEALTDYLLALRALLDGETNAGRASFSLRLAALCAVDHERRVLQRRTELALSLERFLKGGGAGEAYLETVGSESPAALVLEMEEHLRALLRDVLCGYLSPDLAAAADQILLEHSEAPEITARDLRAERESGGDTRVAPEAARPAKELSSRMPARDARGAVAAADRPDEEARSYSAPV